MGQIKVVVVDDHPIVQEGLVRLLECEDGFDCIGAAKNGIEAVRMVSELKPDIVLMDVAMPEMDGIEATKRIKEVCPEIKIIALSAYKYAHHIQACIKAGVDGYLLKDMPRNELVNAIRAAYQGTAVFDLSSSMGLIRSLATDRVGENAVYCKLHDREIEVLKLVANGSSNRAIAKTLNISDSTVGTHLANIFKKINVASRTEAVLYALKVGLISLNDMSIEIEE